MAVESGSLCKAGKALAFGAGGRASVSLSAALGDSRSVRANRPNRMTSAAGRSGQSKLPGRRIGKCPRTDGSRGTRGAPKCRLNMITRPQMAVPCVLLALGCPVDGRTAAHDGSQGTSARASQTTTMTLSRVERVADWRDVQSHPFECPVHETRLGEDVVPIRSGRGQEDELIDDERRGMPYAATYVAGGCVVSEDDPHWARVLFCERCRTAKARQGSPAKR